MQHKSHVLMAEAEAGEGGGGGSITGSAPVQGGIPERFQMMRPDGSLDVEASSLKLAEAYGHLEKRMGSGDLPPKTAEEYQIAVPDALKDQWDPKADSILSGFLQEAHEAGFTQAQIDFAMGKYFELAPQLVSGVKQYSAEASAAQLRQEWTTDEQYQAGISNAYRAAIGYFGQDAEHALQTYGNDPRLIRFLARVGEQMAEDRSIGNLGVTSGPQSAQSAMMSEAYTNANHPDHARVSALVQAHFAKQARES